MSLCACELRDSLGYVATNNNKKLEHAPRCLCCRSINLTEAHDARDVIAQTNRAIHYLLIDFLIIMFGLEQTRAGRIMCVAAGPASRHIACLRFLLSFDVSIINALFSRHHLALVGEFFPAW